MVPPFRSAPVDPVSAARLTERGLRLGLVDTGDADAFGAWLTAEARGFHDERPDADRIASWTTQLEYRRTTGVYEPAQAEPVATVSSWPAELSLPGGAVVPSWAISAVTVSPTHRRRGIARALLEAELRTASALGVPVAMLTVSEATIYARYGFAPAAAAATWTIDTRRAGWAGPAASGQVRFVTGEQLAIDGPAIVDRARRSWPGDIERWDGLWQAMLHLDAPDKAKKLRTVRYDDSDGVPQGFAVYRVTEGPGDFTAHKLELDHLVTVTDDAYAGLWRFLLEIDLVSQVVAPMRPTVEPLYWQVTDPRAVHKTDERDHQWVRILDVEAALTARAYARPDRIVLEVADPLGFADGVFLLEVDDAGAGQVTRVTGEVPDDAAALAMTVNELGALYLGGVAATTLVRAGRVTELRSGSAARVDDALRSPVVPWLSIWY